MSRYLQRLRARMTGDPLRVLQPAQPLRWSTPAADPFVTPEASDAGGLVALAGATPGNPLDRQASLQAERLPIASVSRQGEASVPFESRGTGPQATRSSAQAAFDRSLLPDHPATVEATRPPLSGARARSQDESRARPVDRPAASGTAVVLPPAATLRRHRSGSPDSEPEGSREPGRNSPPVILQAAATPRSVPAPVVAGDAPPNAAATTTSRIAEHSQVFVAAPPPQRSADAAPRRTEVVIGRISVVIDSPRPVPLAPHAAPRPAAASPRPAESAADSVRHFGIGQL